MSGRVAVVVGASSGIGRATAQALAAAGDTVVLVARGETALKEVADECTDRGGRAVVIPADVRDRSALRTVVDETLAEHGRIDVWVHAAAVMAYGRIEDVPAEVFDAVVETNLLGVANAARLVLPVLRAQGAGTLVVVGSLLDKTVTPVMGAYVTSKWGVRALVRVLQLETRDAPEVRVVAVAPAGTDTPIYRQAANYAGFVGRPPPPVDPPEKVAAAVLRQLDAPRRERVTGPTSRVVALGFTVLPWAYDALVGPLRAAFAQTRERVDPHDGNVLAARPDGDALRGGWRSDG